MTSGYSFTLGLLILIKAQFQIPFCRVTKTKMMFATLKKIENGASDLQRNYFANRLS